ncbi:hypothetical protein ACLOJK_020453 [Asimina triloba]
MKIIKLCTLLDSTVDEFHIENLPCLLDAVVRWNLSSSFDDKVRSHLIFLDTQLACFFYEDGKYQRVNKLIATEAQSSTVSKRKMMGLVGCALVVQIRKKIAEK